jgi:ABC-type sugar transport system substrate-binding protein
MHDSTQRMNFRCVVLLVSLLALVARADAEGATVYRWVDKQGKTHFGDSVPSEYAQVAKPVPVRAAAPTVEEQRQARERAAALLAKARGIGAASPASASSASAAAPSARAPSVAPKRPVNGPDEQTDCDTWRRLYRESLDCFGPYRTARGSTKAEAFEHCTPVDEPPERCGRGAQ